MNRTSLRFRQFAATLFLLGFVSMLHFLTGTLDPTLHAWHIFFRKLYFLPIFTAAIWFGIFGGLVTACGAVAVYSLHVWLNWPQAPMEQMNQVGEMASFLLLGAASGALASLEHRTRDRAQKEKVRVTVAALS